MRNDEILLSIQDHREIVAKWMAMCFKLDLPAPLILKAAGNASELIQPTLVPSIPILL